MTIKFNRYFFKDIDFYIWLLLGIWTVYDLLNGSSIVDYVLNGMFLLVAIMGLGFSLFRKETEL